MLRTPLATRRAVDGSEFLQDSQHTGLLIQLDDAGERTFLYWRNQSSGTIPVATYQILAR
ncbi:hypothetical protein O9992_23920 [Vibrio lentus]|nr:hypothetical protein [Vibrio lentus]